MKKQISPGRWVIELATFNRRQYYALLSSPAPLIPERAEAEANARLMAAAPRLLEELKKLVARCDGQEGIQPDGSNMETRSAHQAIIEAEGEDG